MFKVSLAALALLSSVDARQREVELKEIFESSPNFDDTMVKQLLVRNDINHLMLTDVNKLIMRIAREYPDIVSLSSIGTTWQGRPIYMLTVDAKGENKVVNKPAILLTGAHHAREFMSTQMPLYSLLKMIHGATHNDERYKNMLTQNKYYIVPVVNVDGLAEIEREFNKTGKVLTRRKNMNS